ncbi:MAG: FMN-binding negative transcriptional regulator [Chloroflexi bacterium]|nr:FMN-binding negative transcriptional regulator [Chloroflexota bacterium]
MYVPKQYQETDPAVIADFIKHNDFATVISVVDGLPVATHVPLELVQGENGQQSLLGHFARANKHWQSFDPNQQILVIFAGAHSYISPRWYTQPQVPTWNYMVVHVYGKPRLIQDGPELYDMVHRLTNIYEAHAATPPYTVEGLPPDLVEKQLKGIVGFEIVVERIEAKFKMSQNRDAQSYANIIEALDESGDDVKQAVAAEMTRRQDALFGK